MRRKGEIFGEMLGINLSNGKLKKLLCVILSCNAQFVLGMASIVRIPGKYSTFESGLRHLNQSCEKC